MSYLNYEFFEEFRSLDNLCRDIYGESFDNRLGVTLYLEDMDRKSAQGSRVIAEWEADYHQLKSARNLRNELAHSRNSFPGDICSEEDIDFIRSFKMKILNQTDPIALLRKQTITIRSSDYSQSNQSTHKNYPRPEQSGCLGIVASFLISVVCVIIFFL